MASVYEEVVRTFSKTPGKRSEQDVKRLLPWFRKKSELFSNLNGDIVADIVMNCEFSARPRDNIIIKQGERGDCFYVIIRGVVSIFINNALADEDEDAAPGGIRMENLYSDTGVLDRSKFGTFVGTLGPGKSFGELALINKNCIRNASIIADEQCDLMVVNRELYTRCLQAAQVADMSEKDNFILENPLFRKWQQKYRKQLAYSIRKIKVAFNEYVVRQNDPVEGLYFVLSGQAKVVMEPSQHPHQYPQFYPIEYYGLLGLSEEDEPIAREAPTPSTDLTNLPYSQRRRQRHKTLVEICIVSENEVIGDTEVGLSLKTFSHSVICTQQTEVFFLNLRNFDRLVSRKHQKTLNVLRQNAIHKWEVRAERLHDDQVPILKTLIYKMKEANSPNLQAKRKKPKAQDYVVSYETTSSTADFLPQRGPLIDQFGPGTVFYRTRMRAKAKELQKSRLGFRGMQLKSTSKPAPEFQEMEADNLSPTLKVSCDTLHDGSVKSEEVNIQEATRSRKQNIPLHPESIFVDYQGSDRAMSALEARIKEWCSNLSARQPTPGFAKAKNNEAVKLKRFVLDDEKTLLPGTKVILRKRTQSMQPALHDHRIHDNRTDNDKISSSAATTGHDHRKNSFLS